MLGQADALRDQMIQAWRADQTVVEDAKDGTHRQMA